MQKHTDLKATSKFCTDSQQLSYPFHHAAEGPKAVRARDLAQAYQTYSFAEMQLIGEVLLYAFLWITLIAVSKVAPKQSPMGST